MVGVSLGILALLVIILGGGIAAVRMAQRHADRQTAKQLQLPSLVDDTSLIAWNSSPIVDGDTPPRHPLPAASNLPADLPSPVGFTGPVDSTLPTEPAELVDSAEPTGPAEPTEPALPAEPTEPTEPALSVDLPSIAGLTEPVEPAEPIQSALPAEPVEPAEQVHADSDSSHVHPVAVTAIPPLFGDDR